MYKVLVFADPQGRVIAINSDAFLSDEIEGWAEIDEGEGDLYHHAQGNYLPNGLTTEQGIYRYKLVDGQLTERTAEEIQADIDAIPPPPPSPQEQVERQEQRFAALKPIIGDLLTGRTADVVIQLREFMPDWKPGPWATDQSCIDEGYPFRVIHPGHDSTQNPDWRPQTERALFAPRHGKSEETALPWFQPVEAESDYRPGEYMLWTNSVIHRCKQRTNFSPEEYPQAWEYKAEDGQYYPVGDAPVEPDPEEPQELNSNGTPKWGAWVDPQGENSKLYNAGDGVTEGGVKKVSAYDKNGNPPSVAGWWTDYTGA